MKIAMKVPGIINEISHNIAGNKNENRNESAPDNE